MSIRDIDCEREVYTFQNGERKHVVYIDCTNIDTCLKIQPINHAKPMKNNVFSTHKLRNTGHTLNRQPRTTVHSSSQHDEHCNKHNSRKLHRHNPIGANPSANSTRRARGDFRQRGE